MNSSSLAHIDIPRSRLNISLFLKLSVFFGIDRATLVLAPAIEYQHSYPLLEIDVSIYLQGPAKCLRFKTQEPAVATGMRFVSLRLGDSEVKLGTRRSV
jgi:hypothetical protein